MTIARKYLIDYSKTCFYHCMSRCVRQDFLLNTVDTSEGAPNYRNDWIQRRLLYLSNVFAIDLMSFAIMDNHTHLVLFANLDLANQWSNLEVLKRWSKLGTLPLLCQLYLKQDWRHKLNDIELAIVLGQIDSYRNKLTDISTFMSRFNYYIAKRANKEDQAKGHFWEGRFKSQALLDSQAVMSCMFYVDLNPIRAKKSKTLSRSYFTSIKYRLDRAKNSAKAYVVPLRVGYVANANGFGITLEDYIGHLNNLASGVATDVEFPALEFFAHNWSGWSANTQTFGDNFPPSVGEDKLVDIFNRQAKLFSHMFTKADRLLAQTILCRLLGSQYQF